MPRKKPKSLDYNTYISERKELYKYQQAAYDSYEKTLTALTGSTLALSVAFLGFLQSSRPQEGPIIIKGSESWLYLSWLTLTLGLVLLTLCFFLNIRAYSIEIRILERALDDVKALSQRNPLTSASKILYMVSAILFVAGIVSLLYFCHLNLIH